MTVESHIPSQPHPSQPAAHPAVHPEHEVHAMGAEVNNLGMWLFLAGEVMFFGAVFMVYTIYRQAFPEGFAAAGSHLSVLYGGVNTAILLTSSFTMALAVNAAQRGARRSLMIFLLATIVLGAAFLGIKGYEWAMEFQENLFPNASFTFEGADPLRARLFFSLYFAMTGLHALHMVIGLMLLGILLFFAWRGRFTAQNYNGVELVGLFWHFIDLVWIFLFPLLYLIDRV